MKLSIEKTIIPSNGPKGQVWKVEQGTSDLEAALVGKYLGVNIQVKGTNIIKAREEVLHRSTLTQSWVSPDPD